MTQALFLAVNTKGILGEGGGGLVNGVRWVLVNLVSTSTTLQVQTAAAVAANAAYQGTEAAIDNSTMDAFTPAYFDLTYQIGDLSGGPLNANNDAFVMDPNAGLLAATA